MATSLRWVLEVLLYIEESSVQDDEAGGLLLARRGMTGMDSGRDAMLLLDGLYLYQINDTKLLKLLQWFFCLRILVFRKNRRTFGL